MSNILTIDTSTEVCSVALDVEGEIHERLEQQPRMHTALVLPMVDALMRQQALSYEQLDAIAFGRGPGSFTGLRIATGVAQGLGFGLDLPLLPISTLETLAWQAGDKGMRGCVLAALDARIGEIYWGLYELREDGVQALGEEALCRPEELPDPSAAVAGRSCVGAGNGWRYRDAMPEWQHQLISTADDSLLPCAGAMAVLARRMLAAGGGIPAEQAAPLYLRDKVTRG